MRTGEAARLPWNHNIAYHSVVLAAALRVRGVRRAGGVRLGRVLDVGCGDGLLPRRLADIADRAVGIDAARAGGSRSGLDSGGPDGAGAVEFVHGDFMDHAFEPGSFDLVASIAALHHMDAAAALKRMRDLLRPGGVLVVVGLARDLPAAVAAVVANRVMVARRGYQEHDAAKVWPPPLTYRQMRALAERVLPGVRYRRRLLWRYSLEWTKPPHAQLSRRLIPAI